MRTEFVKRLTKKYRSLRDDFDGWKDDGMNVILLTIYDKGEISNVKDDFIN